MDPQRQALRATISLLFWLAAFAAKDDITSWRPLLRPAAQPPRRDEYAATR